MALQERNNGVLAVHIQGNANTSEGTTDNHCTMFQGNFFSERVNPACNQINHCQNISNNINLDVDRTSQHLKNLLYPGI